MLLDKSQSNVLTLLIGIPDVKNCMNRHFTYEHIYQYLITMNIALTLGFHCMSAGSELQKKF